MRIGELSERSGVSPRSLRYYEQHGLLAAARRTNGYRDYGEDAVERARTVHSLLGLGFSRDLVAAALACSGGAAPTVHDEFAAGLAAAREEIGDRIGRLTETHEQLTRFLDARAAQKAIEPTAS